MAIEYTRRFHDIPLPLADLQRHIWIQFQRAVLDKFHEWRTPVLATVDAHGAPQLRTMVLRQVDSLAHQLTFFTDSRSPKVAQLQTEPRASLLFWSDRLGWQLRVQANVGVLLEGPKVDAAWNGLAQATSTTDFLSVHAPGSLLPDGTSTAGSKPYLAVLVAQVTEIDWLELSRSGHRRAQLRGHEAQWLVP